MGAGANRGALSASTAKDSSLHCSRPAFQGPSSDRAARGPQAKGAHSPQDMGVAVTCASILVPAFAPPRALTTPSSSAPHAFSLLSSSMAGPSGSGCPSFSGHARLCSTYLGASDMSRDRVHHSGPPTL